MKPIRLTEELIDEITKEFAESIRKSKSLDGNFTYSEKFEYQKGEFENATIKYSQIAFLKMMTLVNTYVGEVAWHGIVERQGENTFYIKDIIVYPQSVSGATVKIDEEEYAKWSMNFDSDEWNTIRFQGHSHVNFGVTPSSVDKEHQKAILSQLGDDDFYIFTIINKSMDIYAVIYDMRDNVIYDTKEIVVEIEDANMKEFVCNVSKVVKKETTSYTTSGKNAKRSTAKSNAKEEYDWEKDYKKQEDSSYLGGYVPNYENYPYES